MDQDKLHRRAVENYRRNHSRRTAPRRDRETSRTSTYRQASRAAGPDSRTVRQGNHSSRLDSRRSGYSQHDHGKHGRVPARRPRRRRSSFSPVFIIVAAFILLVLFIRLLILGAEALESTREAQRAYPETMTAPAPAEAYDDSASSQTPSAAAGTSMVYSNGRYIDTSKPLVALTFDDGPAGSNGNQIMDALEAVNGRGTFFVVGNRISKEKDEIIRMAKDGHEIGNHSYSHDESMTSKGSDYITSEFSKTDEAVQSVCGVVPALYRLPGGVLTSSAAGVITKPLIYWSLDTADWKTRDTQATVNAVLNQVKDGDIVLMHELYKQTADACTTIIPELSAKGYQLVTVSELIALRNAEVAAGNGIQYKSFPPTASASPSLSVDAPANASTQSETRAEAENSGTDRTAETKKETTAAESSARKKTSDKPKTETKKETGSASSENAVISAADPGSPSASSTEAENAGPGSGDVISADDPTG